MKKVFAYIKQHPIYSSFMVLIFLGAVINLCAFLQVNADYHKREPNKTAVAGKVVRSNYHEYSRRVDSEYNDSPTEIVRHYDIDVVYQYESREYTWTYEHDTAMPYNATVWLHIDSEDPGYVFDDASSGKVFLVGGLIFLSCFGGLLIPAFFDKARPCAKH